MHLGGNQKRFIHTRSLGSLGPSATPRPFVPGNGSGEATGGPGECRQDVGGGGGGDGTASGTAEGTCFYPSALVCAMGQKMTLYT